MDSPSDSNEDTQNDQQLLYELSTINQETLRKLSIASVLCPLENSQIHELESELNQLRERFKLLEDEIVNAKRKRWCNWCLQEALYRNKTNRFYCCSQCEQLDILLSDE